MTHSTANSTHYCNFWLHVFNRKRVVRQVQLPATARQLCGQIPVWARFSSASRPALGQTQPLLLSVKEPLSTLGVKRPECGTDFSSPCRAEVKHNYSCTSEHHLCQSWLIMGWHLHFMHCTFNNTSDATFTDCYSSKH